MALSLAPGDRCCLSLATTKGARVGLGACRVRGLVLEADGDDLVIAIKAEGIDGVALKQKPFAVEGVGPVNVIRVPRSSVSPFSDGGHWKGAPFLATECYGTVRDAWLEAGSQTDSPSRVRAPLGTQPQLGARSAGQTPQGLGSWGQGARTMTDAWFGSAGAAGRELFESAAEDEERPLQVPNGLAGEDETPADLGAPGEEVPPWVRLLATQNAQLVRALSGRRDRQDSDSEEEGDSRRLRHFGAVRRLHQSQARNPMRVVRQFDEEIMAELGVPPRGCLDLPGLDSSCGFLAT